MDDDVFRWDILHKELQHIMQEELNMLREVLSMMKEEEEALLHKDLPSKKQISSKRSLLNKKLKTLQKERCLLTQALTQAANKDFFIHHFNSKNFNLLISEDAENSLETFHLRDQILHLMKNIKQQKDRIAKLIKSGGSLPHLGMEMMPLPKHEEVHKKIQTMTSEDAVNE